MARLIDRPAWARLACLARMTWLASAPRLNGLARLAGLTAAGRFAADVGPLLVHLDPESAAGEEDRQQGSGKARTDQGYGFPFGPHEYLDCFRTGTKTCSPCSSGSPGSPVPLSPLHAFRHGLHETADIRKTVVKRHGRDADHVGLPPVAPDAVFR